MKTKFLKVSLLILTFSLVLGAAVATIVSADGAEPQKPVIVSQNLVYGEDFQIMFAVDASTVTGGSVTFKLYGKEPAQGVEPLKTEVISTVTLTTDELAPPVDSYIYITPGISYSQMLANYYVVAEADGKTSEVKRYSVAEYLYQRLADYNSSEEQVAFYNSSLAFGASIEEVVYNVAEADRVTNYSYVEVADGTLSDGYSAGIYKNETTLTLSDTTKAWKNVKYDENGDFEIVDIVAGSFTVADAAMNNITADNVPSYDPNTDTLNTVPVSQSALSIPAKSASADGKFFAPGDSAVSYRYIKYAGHGVVAAFDTSGGCVMTIPANDTSVSEEAATAFETSFDLRFIPKEGADINSVTEMKIKLRMYNKSNSRLGEFWFLYKYDRTSAVPGSGQMHIGGKTWNNYPVETSGWINVRMVVYASDLNHIYLYVNDLVTAIPVEITAGTISSLADIAGGGFQAGAGNSDAGLFEHILIDNIHSGYTDATLSQ